jgi:acetyltransferase-like isoleucine patch superfamily enzyme
MTTSQTWRWLRFGWAVCSVVVLETVLIGVSAMPVVGFVSWLVALPVHGLMRVAVLALALVPLYALFSLLLIVTSAFATRWLRWRTPSGITARLIDFEWPVLTWGRYLMTIHVVRVLAGPAFRSTPIWSWYMRLNGARIGHLVWVNSLSLMDHNLLDLGDHVVIGADVHMSGHTVERGILKTAPVRLGAGTVIGVGSVVGIGVTTGPETQVGALSVLPKFSTLEGHGSYAGAPAVRLH